MEWITWAAQECDFEGRSAYPVQLKESSLMACLLDGGDDQHLVFTGLQYAGQHLGGLAAAVHFSVNSQRKLIRLAGPLEAGEDGLVYAAVQYPSLRELWPDVYFTEGVKTVQVDMYVVVRTGPDIVKYPGTDLKVTYTRCV